MRKLKIWLLERFLPAWAKDSVYKENQALKAELERKNQEIRELNAYIDGMENAIRRQRITIENRTEVCREHLECDE